MLLSIQEPCSKEPDFNYLFIYLFQQHLLSISSDSVFVQVLGVQQ